MVDEKLEEERELLWEVHDVYEYLKSVIDEQVYDAHGQGLPVTNTHVCGQYEYKENGWGCGTPPLVCFLPSL